MNSGNLKDEQVFDILYTDYSAYPGKGEEGYEGYEVGLDGDAEIAEVEDAEVICTSIWPAFITGTQKLKIYYNPWRTSLRWYRDRGERDSEESHHIDAVTSTSKVDKLNYFLMELPV